MNNLKADRLFHEVKTLGETIYHTSKLSVNQKLLSLHVLKEKAKILPVSVYLLAENILDCYQSNLIQNN